MIPFFVTETAKGGVEHHELLMKADVFASKKGFKKVLTGKRVKQEWVKREDLSKEEEG
jgi:hypothetical protein